jgi:GT2 family glycosyltransferase
MLKISVIIPTRHRNEQLAQCLDRLAPGRQTLPADQYEVIVTDDGSCSTSEAVVLQRYPWARWVAGPRRGPAANRNNGARHARSEWLAFTDDDCVPASDWLAAFEQPAKSEARVLEGKTTCNAGIHTPLQEAPINLTGGNLWSCNFMIRARLFREIGGFDDSFPMPTCEDMELNGRLRKLGHIPQFVPDAIVDHPPRSRPGGWRLGLMWESRVNLWYKEGNVGSVWSWLPVHLLKYRVGTILEYPLRWHTLRAFTSLLSEFTCVLIHLDGWQLRYRPLRPPASGDLPRSVKETRC